MSRRSLRVVSAAVAVAAATVLSACTPTGGTAAQYKDVSVSDQSVQDAVRDILKEEPQSGFNAMSAAVFLVMRDDFSALAKKYGVFVSTDEVKREAFKDVKNPSTAAIESVQGSVHYRRLNGTPDGNTALGKLLKAADVKLNPRYGTWVKGTGPSLPSADWIKTPTIPGLSN